MATPLSEVTGKADLDTRAGRPIAAKVAQALSQVPGTTLALLLYGSYARGNPAPESDIDILQVVPHKAHRSSVGAATIVGYTPDQLRSMSKAGSLFAWHLRTEGVVIHDPNKILLSVLDDHPGPATARTLRRVRELGAVLDVTGRDFALHGAHVLRVARYLLRSAVYARSLEAGESSFAILEASRAAGAEGYLSLLSRGQPERNWPTLISYRDALVCVVGAPLSSNRFGSLEALAVNSWDRDRNLSAIVIQVLSDKPGELDYGMTEGPAL